MQRSKSRWIKILLLEIVLLPLCVAGVELGARGIARARGKPWSPEEARAELEQLARDNRDFVPRPTLFQPNRDPTAPVAQRFLQPYFGYELPGRVERLDAELIEQADLADRKDYVITLLGGSVSQIFSEVGAPRLVERLRTDPRFSGRRLRVCSFGRSGFKEPQQACFFAYALALGFHTDAVINLDGFNEVAIGNQNAAQGGHPAFPSIPHWGFLAAGGLDVPEVLELVSRTRECQREIESWSRRALDWGLERSAVLGPFVLAHLSSLRNERTQLFQRYWKTLRDPAVQRVISGPHCPADLEDPIATSVRNWVESSRTIDALCRARSIPYLHVLQPTLHDPGAKPATEEELREGKTMREWMDGVQRGYPLLRAEGEELAAGGESFFDASRIFADIQETLYYDVCHFNERGNLLLADAMAAAFLAALPSEQ